MKRKNNRRVMLGVAFLGLLFIPLCHLLGEERVDHVNDLSKFTEEAASSEDQKLIISAVRKFLSANIGAEISGKFMIAKTKSGYQINFNSLCKIKDGKEEVIAGGFGDAYVNEAISSMKIDLGP